MMAPETSGSFLKKRQTLEDAIEALKASAHTCAFCGTKYVGGRKGNVYCTVRCARNMAQREYRERARTA